MTNRILEQVFDRLSDIPEGYSEVHFEDCRYRVSMRRSAEGRINNFQAWELGGNDYISLNFYKLESGKLLLKPCEMPSVKVTDFILNMTPVPS